MNEPYWQEDNQPQDTYVVLDDVVDLNFRVRCSQLPLDHAHALSSAVIEALPWIPTEPLAAIHLIHGAESGNGWIRPQNPDDLMFPSRRTLFTLRLPKERVQPARVLAGQTLQLGEYSVTLSAPSVRPLSRLTTLFARYVIDSGSGEEAEFLQQVAQDLQQRGIVFKKMLCGRDHILRFPGYELRVRSVMLDGLEKPASVQLQQEGMGEGLKFGCGIFLPHKGIDPVGDRQEK